MLAITGAEKQYKHKVSEDFPGGPGVKIRCFHYRGISSVPGRVSSTCHPAQQKTQCLKGNTVKSQAPFQVSDQLSQFALNRGTLGTWNFITKTGTVLSKLGQSVPLPTS